MVTQVETSSILDDNLGYLVFLDGQLAWLQWAKPISVVELEAKKACRGHSRVVAVDADEMALWQGLMGRVDFHLLLPVVKLQVP